MNKKQKKTLERIFPQKNSPGQHRPGELCRTSDIKDLAVVLYLLAGRQHILHGGVGVGTLGELHLHLLGHKADGSLFHTGNGIGGILSMGMDHIEE